MDAEEPGVYWNLWLMVAYFARARAHKHACVRVRVFALPRPRVRTVAYVCLPFLSVEIYLCMRVRACPCVYLQASQEESSRILLDLQLKMCEHLERVRRHMEPDTPNGYTSTQESDSIVCMQDVLPMSLRGRM